MKLFFLPLIVSGVVAAATFALSVAEVTPNTVCININDPASNDQEFSSQVIAALSPPCWMNWRHQKWALDDTAFVPMVWKPSDSGLAEAVALDAQYPERIWLIGNEPERPDQNNLSGKDFASIMSRNELPTTFACCGNAIWNGAGSDIGKWQDEYLANGGPVPDYWSITLHGVNNVALWDDFMRTYFEWWKRSGQSKPIIIHETSCMYFGDCNPDLLRHVMDNWDKRIVMLFWFSAVPDPGVPSWNSNLMTFEEQTTIKVELTELGRIYEELK